MEQLDELTLRLVLIEFSKITNIDNQWPTSIPEIVLLTLRITAFSPFKAISGRIMKLIEAYLLIHQRRGVRENEISATLDFLEEQIYQRLMSRVAPEGKRLSNDIRTFERFRHAQQNAINAYWLWRFEKSEGIPPTTRFGKETLHLADRVYPLWLYDDSKFTLSGFFQNDPPPIQPGRPKVW